VPDVRFVCLSDLHLGATNSLLTRLDSSAAADPSAPSAVLEHLVGALRWLIEQNDSATRPTLILNGDILELALAEDNTAAMTFQQLIDLAFPPGARLFDDTLLYLPGNHDHHEWEVARERQYAAYVAKMPLGQRLQVPWHTSHLRSRADLPFVEAELLTTIIRRRADLADVVVQAAYPNLAVGPEATGDERKVVVFHHGHFLEPTYRLMTSLRSLLFPHSKPGLDVWDWEADNFAWIDFVWSTLGRSGAAGRDVQLLYAMLASEDATDALVGNLAGAASRRIPGPGFVKALGKVLLRLPARFLVHRFGTLERANLATPLSPRAAAGLRDYVGGPMARQLDREQPGAREGTVSFVYGHTHKPYEALLPVDGYRQPLAVYNTGGWVVDTLEPAPVQGAAVTVVDEVGDVASVRIYNQVGDDEWRVRVSGPPEQAANPLQQRLSSIVDPDADPWRALSTVVQSGVTERRAALRRAIAEGVRLSL
jgi:hypothetical protein